MSPEEFEIKMNDLKPPPAEGVRQPEPVKLAIVNAHRSAAIGTWFVAVPCYFLFCVFMKYYFHVNVGLFDTMVGLMSDLDRSPVMRVLSPILLVGLPLAGVVLNALAILHFSFHSASRSLVITVKLRWVNIVLMLVSLALAGIFLLYVIVENMHHANP